MMNYGNMGWGMDYWWLGGFVMMVFFAWLLYTLFRRDPEVDFRTETARDILMKRYAAGEITKEEYDRILNDLLQARRTY